MKEQNWTRERRPEAGSSSQPRGQKDRQEEKRAGTHQRFILLFRAERGRRRDPLRHRQEEGPAGSETKSSQHTAGEPDQNNLLLKTLRPASNVSEKGDVSKTEP